MQNENWLAESNKSATLYGMNRFFCIQIESMTNLTQVSYFSENLSKISIYVLPVIALITNSFILLTVLSNAQLNRLSFSVYVKTMAITDTMVLVFKLLSFENKTSKFFYSPALCLGLIFLSDTSILLSVWTIVVITIERTLVVLFPLHIKKMVSKCRARVLVLGITVASLSFSVRVLFIQIDTSSNQTQRCHPLPSWQGYRKLNATITEFAYCFIPLAIVIISNCITLFTVRRVIFQRNQILTNRTPHQTRQSVSNENQLMLMLLVVTLMFIVYFVPYTIANVILRWGLPFGFCFTRKAFQHYVTIRSFCELLKDLNFCTNFFIYCVNGRQFRHALFSLFRQRRSRLLSSVPHHDSTRQRRDTLLQQNAQNLCQYNLKLIHRESQC